MGKKPTKVLVDEVYVIACLKSELHFDEHKKGNRERENKRAQLKVGENGWVDSVGDRGKSTEK